MAAIMAKWGKKTFKVTRHAVKPIQDVSFAYEKKENKKNKDKKKRKSKSRRRLEKVEVSCSTTLIEALMKKSSIKKELNQWRKQIGKAHYLIIGGRNFGPNLELIKVSVSDLTIDDRGRYRTAKLDFEFRQKGYKFKSSSVKSSAKKVKASKDYKISKKKKNAKLEKAKKNKKSISTGDYVRLTGSSASDSEKRKKYKVTSVNEEKNQVSVSIDGKTRKVKLSEVTMSTSKR